MKNKTWTKSQNGSLKSESLGLSFLSVEKEMSYFDANKVDGSTRLPTIEELAKAFKAGLGNVLNLDGKLICSSSLNKDQVYCLNGTTGEVGSFPGYDVGFSVIYLK